MGLFRKSEPVDLAEALPKVDPPTPEVQTPIGHGFYMKALAEERRLRFEEQALALNKIAALEGKIATLQTDLLLLLADQGYGIRDVPQHRELYKLADKASKR